MILSPKDRFLANAELSKAHSNTVSSSHFSIALDAALLEYSAQCSREKNPADAGLLLRGAHEFVVTFCDLSEPRMRFETKDRDNL